MSRCTQCGAPPLLEFHKASFAQFCSQECADAWEVRTRLRPMSEKQARGIRYDLSDSDLAWLRDAHHAGTAIGEAFPPPYRLLRLQLAHSTTTPWARAHRTRSVITPRGARFLEALERADPSPMLRAWRTNSP